MGLRLPLGVVGTRAYTQTGPKPTGGRQPIMEKGGPPGTHLVLVSSSSSSPSASLLFVLVLVTTRLLVLVLVSLGFVRRR